MIQSFVRSLTIVLEMFALIAAGFAGRKLRVLGETAIEGCTAVLMEIAVPASIIHAAKGIELSTRITRNVGVLLLITVAGYLAMFLISAGISKWGKFHGDDRTTLTGVAVFKNIAFMGLPFCSGILGSWSTFYVAFCMIVFNLAMWTFGIYWYSGGTQFQPKRLLKNTALLASLVMILLICTGSRLPEPLWTVTDMAGSLCTPLSLIIMGIMLANIRFSEAFRRSFYYLSSFLTLIAGSLIILFMVCLLRPEKEVAQVLLVLSTMPAATLNPVVAKEYGTAGENVSVAVLHGMVLSLATMPVFTSVYLAFLG